jgi:DnaJ-class molecular chaperone
MGKDTWKKSTFHSRKEARTEYYLKYVYGHKLVKCTACNGSGYYDGPGQNDCGGCEGSGKERISPAEYERRRAFEAEWGQL